MKQSITNHLHFFLFILLFIQEAFPISAQLPPSAFSHPFDPHQTSILPKMIFPELFDDPDRTITIPVVVVLMQFTDLPPENPTENSVSKYRDIVFGENDEDDQPTVKEFYNQVSNGRIQIIPVDEAHQDGGDGIIGWVTAQHPYFDFYKDESQKKRAEAIRLADSHMSFSKYDLNGDKIISPHELIVFLVNPDSGGGQTDRTDPVEVEVDGGDLKVRIPVGALGETRDAVSIAHEIAHPLLGLPDLYHKCPDGSQPGCNSENPCPWELNDGYICEIAADACKFPDNTDCSCPDALDARKDEGVLGNTTNFPIADVGSACGSASAINSKTAWYEVYGNGNRFTASTCGALTLFDTQITVFCNSCSKLTCVAGNNDDSNCSNPHASTVSWCTKAGASYLIAVHGSNGDFGSFGLQVSDSGNNDCHPVDCGLAAAYGRHWYPFIPKWASIMAESDDESKAVISLDPWAKIHLGFTQPKVIDHDGTYTVYAEEPVRSFNKQNSQPEAFIIYDPQGPLFQPKPMEYFIIEARNDSRLKEQGMAIWLINENATPFPNPKLTNYRRMIRLIHSSGHNPDDNDAILWNGDSNWYYDLTSQSSPRNSNWSNGKSSYVEIYDISGSGESMSFSVQIPPIFVDHASIGIELGSQGSPYHDLPDALVAIFSPPRTIMMRGGTYSGISTIAKPCTIKQWKGGEVIIKN